MTLYIYILVVVFSYFTVSWCRSPFCPQESRKQASDSWHGKTDSHWHNRLKGVDRIGGVLRRRQDKTLGVLCRWGRETH